MSDTLYRLVSSDGSQAYNAHGPAIYMTLSGARNARAQLRSRFKRWGIDRELRIESLGGSWELVSE